MVLPRTVASLRLADVLSSCLLAMTGQDNPLSLTPVRRAAVVLIDGLGARNLEARRGHARWLVEKWRHRGLIGDSGFPSTTASALASLTTGVGPGEHGIVGYTVRDPASGALINHLKEWEPHVHPDTWQRSSTQFEQAATLGIPSLSMGERRFEGTGFTRAVWRGAEFVGTDSLEDQFQRVRDFFDSHDRGLAYLYWPALDRTGHSSGVDSDAWIRRLEDLDTQLRSLDALLGSDEGAVITADHGMVDVADGNKLMVTEDSALLHSVVAWAGEPRAVQLYLDNPSSLESVMSAWKEAVGNDALVLSKEQLLQEDWLGPVSPDVESRIGDVLVAATASTAFYRSEVASAQSMKMVGQHGSITSEERDIPIIPVGAWG